jgi:hypothetical protein
VTLKPDPAPGEPPHGGVDGLAVSDDRADNPQQGHGGVELNELELFQLATVDQHGEKVDQRQFLPIRELPQVGH